jgi:uncharacterized protein YjbI with pentapeptide repeats
VDSSVVGYDGGRNVSDEERRLNSKSGWKPWKPALSSKSGSEKKPGPWRPTKRQVLWAVGTLFTLVTIALLVALLVVNLDALKWEDLSRERLEQVALFIGIAVALTTLFVLLAIGGASLGWTGFGDKTFWDWLQLLSALAIPVVLAAAGLWFTAQQDQRQQRTETQRAEAERELAEQRAQDEALQAYLNQMSQLILDRKLLEAEQDDPVYTLAQARTSTIILRLDAEHNESVTRFLINSGLAESSETAPRLLSEIALVDAKLSGADLPKADLSGADLSGADLSGADLSGADLSVAFLNYADLRGADLSGASLSGALLGRADLSGAFLARADLSDAYLFEADLSGAEAITNKELDRQAALLKGATMPNGQKYEDWIKGKDQEENKKSDGSS